MHDGELEQYRIARRRSGHRKHGCRDTQFCIIIYHTSSATMITSCLTWRTTRKDSPPASLESRLRFAGRRHTAFPEEPLFSGVSLRRQAHAYLPWNSLLPRNPTPPMRNACCIVGARSSFLSPLDLRTAAHRRFPAFIADPVFAN